MMPGIGQSPRAVERTPGMPHSVEQVTVAGATIRLFRGGSGQPLVFLHGAGGHTGWMVFLEELSTRYEVFAPEHPGFGQSDDPPWLDDVADEEAAIFATAGRAAITSAEEPLVLARIPARLQRITFGKSPTSDVKVESRTVGAGGRAKIRIALSTAITGESGPRSIDLDIGLLGETAATNCAAAIAGVAAMRQIPLTARELRAIADAFAVIEPVAGRLAISTIRDIHVIDDTYNSNPRSIRAALAASREVADGLGARLVIAMGDMLELGALSRDAHLAAVHDVLDQRPAAFIAVGREMTAAIATIGAAETANIITASDSVAAGKIVASIVRASDVLLIKGSRGIAMERILDTLRAA
jgi:UDP-N-acetylmuramoyl-tripeptide--D-alanyl-D-alanine ligase